MIAMTIIGIISTFAIPKYQGYIEKARYARCVAEIRYLERDIQAYYVANEKYPSSLADLGVSINGMLDPWGNMYQYLLIAGTKWASNKGTGGTYYVRHFDWTADVVAAAEPAGMRGFWTGSWFVSEAWATQPDDPGGGQGGGNAGGNSGGGGGGGQGGGNAGGNSGGGQGGGQGGGGGGGGGAKPRKDRFLVPINSDYDLYSMGPDGESVEPLTAAKSHDDIIRASNGAYVGVAENF
jgi:general secretion pathway protein G